MTTNLKIDKDKKIIQGAESNLLDTDQCIKLARELSLAADRHKGYNILMDFRETVTGPEMHDLMAITSACSRLRKGFDNKIAFLIPNTEERVQYAKLFRTCMVAQGFRLKHFFDRESALEWFSEKS